MKSKNTKRLEERVARLEDVMGDLGETVSGIEDGFSDTVADIEERAHRRLEAVYGKELTERQLNAQRCIMALSDDRLEHMLAEDESRRRGL